MTAQLVDFGNGFSAYTAAEFEARFIYNEIFNEDCYDVAQLPEKPFLIDVGANIGMFSIYMKRKFPEARIMAFEPAPVTYDMHRNLKLHNATDVETHRCALGSTAATGTLTFFPNFPGNSTFVPEEKKIMRTLIEERYPQETVEKVFSGPEQIDVPVKRLSDFLRDQVDLQIDLLKIDVEARELDVCRGLDDEHWARVRNVVIEIFDVDGALAAIEDFVKTRGFIVKTELAIPGQDDPAKPRIWNLVGHRDSSTN